MNASGIPSSRRAFLKEASTYATLLILPPNRSAQWLRSLAQPPLIDHPPITLANAAIRVTATVRDGQLLEHYEAKRDGRWFEVATSAQGGTVGPIAVRPTPTSTLSGTVHRISLTDGTLVEECVVGTHRLTRTLRLIDDTPWIHVVTRLEPSEPLSLWQFADHLQYPTAAEWSFAASMGGFVPDAQYKAPVVDVQTGRTVLALVPDLQRLTKDVLRRCNHAVTLDARNTPVLSAGFMRATLVAHSIYDANAEPWIAADAAENAYYIHANASAAPAHGYRDVVRFHWNQFGRPAQAQAAAQQAGVAPQYRALRLWDEWRDGIWHRQSHDEWLTVPLPNGATGGGVATKRWGPGPSIYLSAWFNSMRTAYGMGRYAARTGQHDLLTLATQTVTLAVNAPGVDGAFKCIAVPTTTGVVWGVGDGTGSGVRSGFLGYDMCWTAYWLLRWRAAQLPGSDHVLDRCRRLAAFMMRRQLADGMFPTQFTEDGTVNDELSRVVKAETGPVALFLLELYAQDKAAEYRHAAERALAFLDAHVVPARQWYDFETFWSCSPRQPRFDERTRQWPANNLALSQTVAAYLRAYQLTGMHRYLATGEALLDYLLLYQQCWTNPTLDDLSCPTMLLGGFTTQNSDAEWSDARQSQIGNVLLDYYRTTGNIEYLERGVAALRAQFPVSPYENWAHTGMGGTTGVSSFHWGTGSGMAGIEIDHDVLRDAVVDVRAGRGVGVNGLDLTACTVEQHTIRFDLRTPFDWPHSPTVVFNHAVPTSRYVVHVNGTVAGTWSGAELARGVPIMAVRNSRPE